MAPGEAAELMKEGDSAVHGLVAAVVPVTFVRAAAARTGPRSREWRRASKGTRRERRRRRRDVLNCAENVDTWLPLCLPLSHHRHSEQHV